MSRYFSEAGEKKLTSRFSVWERKSIMRRLLIVLVFYAVPVSASADKTKWRRYGISSTGAKVDIPVSIFTEDAGPPRAGRDVAFSPRTDGQISPYSPFQIPRMTFPVNFFRRGSSPPVFSTSE